MPMPRTNLVFPVPGMQMSCRGHLIGNLVLVALVVAMVAIILIGGHN